MKYQVKNSLLLLLIVLLASCAKPGVSSSQGNGAAADAAGAMANVAAESYGVSTINGISTAACALPPQRPGYVDYPVYFDFDKTNLHGQYLPELARIARLLARGHASLRIEGNTDDRGSREYNVALGWRRARAVANYMQGFGLGEGQSTLVSYGAERPIAFGNTAVDYQCNRRVDIIYKR